MSGDGRRLRLAVAGLGRAFTLMLPTLTKHPAVELVAAADPRPEARARFAADFGARTFESVERLCTEPGIDAIYVATPHQHHAAHVVAAASAGKHVLVEKPFAVGLDEAHAMVEAAEAARVHLVVGHSHSFDAPIALARRIVAGGTLGRVRMISALAYTDFLYRPRRPEELQTARGGGVVFSQCAHQMDVVRLLGGGRVRSVRAATGAWDPARATEGAYAALLTFEDGAFASMAYNGYGFYDSDELMGWIGELGRPKPAGGWGSARRALAGFDAGREAEAKSARNYGGAGYREAAPAATHEHFGFVVVSCEHGDLRPRPDGVEVFGADGRRFEPLAPP
ncbi:MAG TPA: Gfo/Idh/MocA family oxidoreductase, partial [Usitatibacter sp.]|nr:Gfo/Idh/MocA family oxidoreductase [Usitatibacter sp.]